MKIIYDYDIKGNSEESEEKPIKKNVNKNKNKDKSKKIVKENKTKRETIKKENEERDNDLESVNWFKEAEGNIIKDNTSSRYKRDIKAIDELSKIIGNVGYKK